MTELAITGGIPTVRGPVADRWLPITELERRKVLDVLDGQVMSLWGGGVFEEFCQRVAEMSGHRDVLPTCNGTTALLLALMAAEVGPGDEVLLPVYGYFAAAGGVVLLGATPVFCDIDPETMTIDPADVRRRLTGRVRAIVAQHTWGNPADLERLLPLSRSVGATLIADAAHAHGARLGGCPLGGQADVSCYSFGLGKLASGGELGAATTSDRRLHERMVACGGVKMLRACAPSLREDFEEALPLKARPHPCALAIGCAQLARLPERLARSRAYAEEVLAGLSALDGLHPQQALDRAERVFWRIALRVRPEATPDRVSRLTAALRAEGVPLLDDEYPKPLDRWKALAGRDFLRRRFEPGSPAPAVLPGVASIIARTVFLRPMVIPDPPDLARRIVSAFRKVWTHEASTAP
jgi:dTDP-4-amino-4,6-dideoxygalactose transaminase